MRFLMGFIFALFITASFAQPQGRVDNNIFAPNRYAPINPSTGTGAQGREGSYHREQAYHIPLKGEAGRRIAALVYRPITDQPRPLAIITHGTDVAAAKNADWRTGFHPHAIDYFLERGYIVAVVHRRGYGLTGGKPSEGFSCALPQHLLAGENSSTDLTSVLDFMIKQSFVKDKGAIIIGQSTGGWAAIATGAQGHPSLAATINFAGGRRGNSGKDGSVCALDELVRDAAILGKKSKTKSLWIYTKNDQTFNENLIVRLHSAYSSAGAPVEFHLLEGFGKDGHSLFPNPRGMQQWGGIVRSFLGKL